MKKIISITALLVLLLIILIFIRKNKKNEYSAEIPPGYLVKSAMFMVSDISTEMKCTIDFKIKDKKILLFGYIDSSSSRNLVTEKLSKWIGKTEWKDYEIVNELKIDKSKTVKPHGSFRFSISDKD